MNRADLQALQAIQTYPAVSILLPTQRGTGADDRDRIRFKNSVQEAEQRLLAEFAPRQIAPLLQQLHTIAEQLDHRQNQEGLAVFATADSAQVFDLAFAPRAQVVVDDTFATAELVRGLHHAGRYWVVTLTGHQARVFEAITDRLVELTEYGFPLASDDRTIAAVRPGGRAANPTVRPQEENEPAAFFQRVSETFAMLQKTDPVPVAVVAIDRYLSMVAQGNLFPRRIATVGGSFDYKNAQELGAVVWPVMEPALEGERALLIGQLEEAEGAGRVARGLQACWEAAAMDRGQHLVVEEGYREPVLLGRDRLSLEFGTGEGPGALDDGVDALVELVLERGGQVTFVPEGTYAARGRVALLLRF